MAHNPIIIKKDISRLDPDLKIEHNRAAVLLQNNRLVRLLKAGDRLSLRERLGTGNTVLYLVDIAPHALTWQVALSTHESHEVVPVTINLIYRVSDAFKVITDHVKDTEVLITRALEPRLTRITNDYKLHEDIDILAALKQAIEKADLHQQCGLELVPPIDIRINTDIPSLRISQQAGGNQANTNENSNKARANSLDETESLSKKASLAALSRYGNISFPATTQVAQPVTLKVSISQLPNTRQHTPLALSAVSPPASLQIDVFVFLSPLDFELRGAQTQKILVPLDSDSGSVTFQLVPKREGIKVIAVEFLQNANYLGRCEIETVVNRRAERSASISVQSTLTVNPTQLPPDLTILFDRVSTGEGKHYYRFRLLSLIRDLNMWFEEFQTAETTISPQGYPILKRHFCTLMSCLQMHQLTRWSSSNAYQVSAQIYITALFPILSKEFTGIDYATKSIASSSSLMSHGFHGSCCGRLTLTRNRQMRNSFVKNIA